MSCTGVVVRYVCMYVCPGVSTCHALENQPTRHNTTTPQASITTHHTLTKGLVVSSSISVSTHHFLMSHVCMSHVTPETKTQQQETATKRPRCNCNY